MVYFEALQVLAAIVTIVFLPLKVSAGAKAWYAAAIEASKRAQEELATACQLVEAASSSQPARADLSTYVLLEIDRQNESIGKCRLETLKYTILSPVLGLGAVFIQFVAQDSIGAALSWGCAVMMIHSGYSAIRWGMKESSLNKHIEEYRRASQKVWLHHINKRVPTSV